MKFNPFYILLFALSLDVPAVELYKIVNKDGTVTYTDIPTPEAEYLNLSSKNSAVMPSLAPSKNTQLEMTKNKKIEKRLPDYEMRLLSPHVAQSIHNNQGKVSVRGELVPNGAGQFQLFLDNKMIDSKSTPVFELENVDRGEHLIQIKFLHNSGKILASTPEQVFYLHKASTLLKAR